MINHLPCFFSLTASIQPMPSTPNSVLVDLHFDDKEYMAVEEEVCISVFISACDFVVGN